VLSGLNFRAITIGWVIDVVGSNVISIAALVFVMVSKGIDVLDLADQAVFTRLALGPEVITVSFIGGSVLSIVAAYVAARMVLGVVLGYVGGWVRLMTKPAAANAQ
jgi:small-conductance mechanosensitive channel